MAFVQLGFHSDALRLTVNVNVILPQAPTTQIGLAGRRDEVFPTLYLLHGLSDDHTIWQRLTSVERYASRYGIAVVMPTCHRSWYTDMVHGGAYFTYIAEELPAVCRSFFRGMSEDRAYNYIAGLSMGGYGAMKIAFAHPERFAGAASFSGALDVYSFCKNDKDFEHSEWANIFGAPENIPGTVNDVFGTAERQIAAGATLPELYISCGVDDFLLSQSRKLHALLDDHGVAHTYREAPGNHNWEFWDDEIERTMAHFFGK